MNTIDWYLLGSTVMAGAFLLLLVVAITQYNKARIYRRRLHHIEKLCEGNNDSLATTIKLLASCNL